MGRGVVTVVLEYELFYFIDNFDSIQPERGLFMPCYNVVHTYIHTYIHTECVELEHGVWIDIVNVIGCKILFVFQFSHYYLKIHIIYLVVI